jgi:hypothetical protein
MIAPATRQVNPLQNTEVCASAPPATICFWQSGPMAPASSSTMQDSTKIDIQLSAGTFYMISENTDNALSV